MKQFLLGVLVGGVAAFGTGFLRAAGSSAWQGLALRTAKVRRAVRAKRQERSAKRAAAKAATELADERTRLKAERVGAKFRKRYTADDTGTIVTVRELRNPNWQEMVNVKEVAPAAREPTEFDNQFPARYGIKWSDLTKSDSEQRHLTARVMAESFDDADGWIEFERLD